MERDRETVPGRPIPDDTGPSPWPQVERHFADLLEQHPEERHRRLDRIRAADPALARELSELLDASVASASWLEPPEAGLSGLRTSDSSSAEWLATHGATRPGDLVGPWRLLEPLGHGGMGEVFLAERADGAFTMRAALKLIRRGMDTDDVLRRFRVERQVLADLVHPGIARLLDGGATDDGRPYLVMEHVRGVSLDTWCDEHRLDVRERLVLFARVCDAVQVAHDHGVVHRDLKPGNLLVTPEGDPKLLDFGIAKLLLDEDALHSRVLTLTGQQLLTPRYASPEQVRGEPVTPATDAYALGILLYELLTGRTPHRTDTGTLHELASAVCDEDPSPPSLVVGWPTRTTSIARADEELPTAQHLAQKRATDVVGLRRELRGDLDTIVLHALRKDAERRYPSASALAADLRRHLRGHPIHARPDTLRYRVLKFVRRNRTLVGVTLAFLLVLLTGLITSLQLWAEAERSRRANESTAYSSGIAAAEAAIRDGRVGEARSRLDALPSARRGWEWRHLYARLDDASAAWPAGVNSIVPVPLSDGRLLSVSADGLVFLDRAGEVTPLGVADGSVTALAIEPGGARLAMIDARSIALEVDLTSLTTRVLDPGHAVGRVAWLGDGRLAVCQFESLGVIDTSTGARIATWSNDGAQVTAMATDGRDLIATGSSDHIVRVFDAAGHRRLALPGHRQRILSLAFDASRARLASASLDGSARLWDLTTGDTLLTVQAQTPLNTVALVGDELWTAGESGVIERWDVHTGARSARLVGHLAAIDGGAATGWADMPLVTRDIEGAVRLWQRDAADVSFLATSIWVHRVAIGGAGRRLASDAPDGRLRCWSLPERTLLWERAPDGILVGVAFDRAGMRIAVSRDDALDDGVTIHAVDDGRTLTRLVADDGRIGHGHADMVWLDDGRLAVLRSNGLLRVWNADLTELELTHPVSLTGLSVVELPGTLPAVLWSQATVLLVPDGWRIVVPDDSARVTSAALSPDGSRLVLAMDDRELRVLVPPTGEILAHPEIGRLIYAMAFAPDGRRLAVAGEDGTVTLLDTESWEVVAGLHGHSGRVRDLVWTPDGATLVSCGLEGRLGIWSTTRP